MAVPSLQSVMGVLIPHTDVKEAETEQKFLDQGETENFHGDRDAAAAVGAVGAVGAVAVLFEAGTLHRPRLGAGGRRGDPNGGLRGGRHGGRPGLTGTTGDGQILQDGCKVDPERKMWGTR